MNHCRIFFLDLKSVGIISCLVRKKNTWTTKLCFKTISAEIPNSPNDSRNLNIFELKTSLFGCELSTFKTSESSHSLKFTEASRQHGILFGAPFVPLLILY